jgi:hypothetical protein
VLFRRFLTVKDRPFAFDLSIELRRSGRKTTPWLHRVFSILVIPGFVTTSD